MNRKVIIIGLDGATFEVLEPWMAAGHLPHLQAMRAAGVSGPLRSCVPPVTAPAWTSFMTGKNPGKHGVFDFVIQEPTSYRFHPVNSRHRHSKVLWELIGEQGGHVAVLNVPMTHPPYPVNGVLVSDFLLATGKGGQSYPPELIDELQRRFGPYPSDAVLPYFVVTQDDADIRRFIGEYRDALEYKFGVAEHLLEQTEPDFLMLHLYGNDQICHWLWHVIDRTHPEHQLAQAARLMNDILEYYRAFDARIGRLRQRLDEQTSLWVISDHGFGPVYKAIDLNTWLYQEGYLALKQTPMTRLRRALWQMGLTPNSFSFITRHWLARQLGKLARYVVKDSSYGGVDRVMQGHRAAQWLLSFDDIDWSRTVAYSPFGFGQIRINVQGTWAHGSVPPGPEYERLKQEIASKLRAYCDPETGKPLEADVFTKDEIYHGEFFDVAPDILFVPVNGRYRPKSAGFTSNAVISHFLGMTGIHKMNGILLAEGTPFRHGTIIEDASIVDVLPTVLYLLGVPIPNDVDGMVLQPMFTSEFLQQHPIRLSQHAATALTAAGHAADTQDKEEVIERLRSLGYLD